MSRIHILHENSAWLPPLAQAFDQRRLPWTEWFLDAGTFDLAAPPPQGVFYNRMSASSHTRDHRFAAELTAAVLAWLVRWDRRVVNGPGALDLEISKARQYAALEGHGIATPRTVLIGGRERVAAAALRYFADQPFILKPNRGGKGLGVQLFASVDSLTAYLPGGRLRSTCGRDPSVAGIRQSPAPVHHARRIRRRALPLCCRSRYQRRLRTLPGGCVCHWRRQLSGWRGAAHKFTIIDGIPRRCGRDWSAS